MTDMAPVAATLIGAAGYFVLAWLTHAIRIQRRAELAARRIYVMHLIEMDNAKLIAQYRAGEISTADYWRLGNEMTERRLRDSASAGQRR